MANPLYNAMNQNAAGFNKASFMQRLQQLKSMGGDPNKHIQNLLNSGRITQEDYNNAVKRADELKKIFG
jgi:hypothetical protein